MSQKLNDQIIENMRKKNTTELLMLWEENDRQTISKDGFEAIKSVLLERGETLPLQKTKNTKDSSVSEKVTPDLLWSGEVPLVTAYWLYGVCVNMAFYFLISFFSYYSNGESMAGTAVVIILTLMQLIYYPFILISTWRSANKYVGPNYWAALAKLVVIFGWGGFLKALLELLSALLGQPVR